MTYKIGTVGDFMKWTMTVAKNPQRAGEQPRQWRDLEETARNAEVSPAEVSPAEVSPQAKISPKAGTSPEAMVKLLSEDNLALLKLIGTREFTSMRQLAAAAKRKEPNLSVTLRKLADAGIVTLDQDGKALRPRLAASRVTLELDLMGIDSAVSVRAADIVAGT